MEMPEVLSYTRVDTIIECLPLGAASGKKWPHPEYSAISAEVQAKLLEAMPNAYGGEAPGEDDWPEPDAARDEPYKLSKIWDKLDEVTQQRLIAAVEQEYGERCGQIA